MLLEQLDVSSRVKVTGWFLLFRLGQFALLEWGACYIACPIALVPTWDHALPNATQCTRYRLGESMSSPEYFALAAHRAFAMSASEGRIQLVSATPSNLMRSGGAPW